MDFGEDRELKIRENVVDIRGRHDINGTIERNKRCYWNAFRTLLFRVFLIVWNVFFYASGALSFLQYLMSLLECFYVLLERIFCTSGVFLLHFWSVFLGQYIV